MFEITFGMALDGARWTNEAASIGKMKCGPLGMLKFLETRYALGGVEASEFERVDAYVRKMRAACCEWCRESFSADPWSTASTLLAWRDELVSLKWNRRSSGDSVRIGALAQIEAAGPELPLGIADRLVRILAEAKDKIAAELTLVDAFDDLPLIWREIITTCFESWKAETRQEAALPEVVVVKGVNEMSLARDVARYISAGGEERVAVISEVDTQVLDTEMERLGLPTFGVSAPSRERKPLQTLLAALSEYGRTRAEEEYPTKEIVDVLDQVTRELRKDIERNPLSKLASSHVAELKSKLSGMDAVRRSALWRMVQMVVGEGARSPYSRHELGGPRFLRSPAELTDETDVVLWWLFVPSGRRSGLLFREEEKALLGRLESGLFVVDDERARRNRCEAKAWDRCLSRIKKRLLLFIPDVIMDEVTGVHPFYDVLLKRLGKEPKDLEIRNAEFVKGGTWSMAGRTVKLELKDVSHPKFSDVYKIEPNAEMRPRSLSPTQLESFLACPFQWYHRYYLELTTSEPAKSETTKTRQGNMAHKMVEELVATAADNEEEVKNKFPTLFEQYCDGLIPEYAEPDRKMERESYRKKLLSSLIALWKLMSERGLKPVSSEYKFNEKDFCGVPFSGRADLILEGLDGRRHIFDFKWSSRKDYADKIKEGTSVQLAAYDWLSGFGSESGYYLFPKEKLIPNTQDNREVWENVVATYKKRLGDLQAGTVAKGIDIGLDSSTKAEKERRRQEVASQGLAIDVHAGCRYCDFKALCGKLWEEEGGAE